MVSHNNVLPHVHLHKWWQRHVRTWFDQPARKTSRRLARQKKAAKMAPRPTEYLRPIVHPPTQFHNIKKRMGKGFTLDELKSMGLTKTTARMMGISVDHRRKNTSLEGMEANKARLKTYLQKLVMFPKRSKPKKGFAGLVDDCTNKEMRETAKQVSVSEAVPMKKKASKSQTKIITEEDRKFQAYAALRKAHRDEHNFGKHQKKQEA